MFTSVEIKAQNGGSCDHIQGSHYFQIGGRSDFSFRELAGRLLGEINSDLIETLFRDPSDVTLPKFSK